MSKDPKTKLSRLAYRLEQDLEETHQAETDNDAWNALGRLEGAAEDAIRTIRSLLRRDLRDGEGNQ